MHFREMTLEGILGIQAGDNPRVIEEKLMAFVPPAERVSATGGGDGGGTAEKQAA
jgi:chemotaxis protein MotA